MSATARSDASTADAPRELVFAAFTDAKHIGSVFPTAAIRDKTVKEVGAIEGGKQTLARLAAYLDRNP